MDAYSIAETLYKDGYRADDIYSLMSDYGWTDWEANEIAKEMEAIEDYYDDNYEVL